MRLKMIRHLIKNIEVIDFENLDQVEEEKAINLIYLKKAEKSEVKKVSKLLKIPEISENFDVYNFNNLNLEDVLKYGFDENKFKDSKKEKYDLWRFELKE